ncbi:MULTISPECIES: GGDEF domain-containing protein [unclassified Roseovarius]|uniref:GGDEF domain-containing protein n=1 Tax=unclassified Roseovarius TaxID=2614913 RepID=UPI00273FEE10|nr:GGDEF domain-containing protein [Roseovarius sp. MMSF_3350]
MGDPRLAGIEIALNALSQAAMVVDGTGAIVLDNRPARDRYGARRAGGIVELAEAPREQVVAELRRVLRTTGTSFLRLFRNGSTTALFKLKRLDRACPAQDRLILVLEDQNKGMVSKFLKARELVKTQDGALQLSLRRQADLRREARKLRELGRIDPVTGLLNRRAFEEAVRNGLRRASGAVLFCDLDDFKAVNDRLGHGAGDSVLQQAALRLREVFEVNGICGRIGGDEFAAWLPAAGRDEAEMSAQAVERSFARHFGVGDAEAVAVGLSVGVAVAPEDGSDFEALMACADMRMYAAKARPVVSTGSPGVPDLPM